MLDCLWTILQDRSHYIVNLALRYSIPSAVEMLIHENIVTMRTDFYEQSFQFIYRHQVNLVMK